MLFSIPYKGYWPTKSKNQEYAQGGYLAYHVGTTEISG